MPIVPKIDAEFDQARIDARDGRVDIERGMQEPFDDEQQPSRIVAVRTARPEMTGPSLANSVGRSVWAKNVRQSQENQRHRGEVDGVGRQGCDGQVDGCGRIAR